MVYFFLAEGFEETEALLPADILRRGGVDVSLVGVSSDIVTGAHGISVKCDISAKDAAFDNLKAVVLPGGMPGTRNLKHNDTVQSFVDYAAQNGLLLCAICAAPAILGRKGLLAGKKAVCYPGLESHLDGAVISDRSVVVEDNIITAKGPGAAADFGFAILEKLKGAEIKNKIKSEMCFKG